MPEKRRETAELNALAKLSVMNTMMGAIEESMAVLLQIMRNGEKDSDRLKAVDRVLELAGIRTDKPLVQVQVNHGLRPQEDTRDARLLGIIQRVDEQRAALLREKAIEAVARDAG